MKSETLFSCSPLNLQPPQQCLEHNSCVTNTWWMKEGCVEPTAALLRNSPKLSLLGKSQKSCCPSKWMSHHSHIVHVDATLREAENLPKAETQGCFFRNSSGARGRNGETMMQNHNSAHEPPTPHYCPLASGLSGNPWTEQPFVGRHSKNHVFHLYFCNLTTYNTWIGVDIQKSMNKWINMMWSHQSKSTLKVRTVHPQDPCLKTTTTGGHMHQFKERMGQFLLPVHSALKQGLLIQKPTQVRLPLDLCPFIQQRVSVLALTCS